MVSQLGASIRIVMGTILGGALGFYVMHRIEASYKERRKEELMRYQKEMERRQQAELQVRSEFFSDS